MKRRRIALIAIVTVGVLALALYLSPRDSGYATPTDCLDAYRDASKDGDVARLMSCLGEPLRSSTRDTRESLQERMRGVGTWAQHAPVSEGSDAYVDVDETGPEAATRVRYHLQKTGRGWLIVGIDAPQTLTASPRHGTDVRNVREK